MRSIIHKIKTLFVTRRIFWIKIAESSVFKYIPDKLALKIQYKNVFNRKLDLKNPKSFNEKLQWLKLYDRKPNYTTLVDKYAVKKYVENIIGKEHIIPTLGVYNSFDDIVFDDLPEQFVLKCTHGSGDAVICRDKQHFDFSAARKSLTKALHTDYYSISRCWPYKNVPRKIIAEPYMHNGQSYSLEDYKFFCFNGIPKCLFVATDRSTDCRFDYFDMDFNHLPINNIHENSDKIIEKPECFDEMKRMASILSKGFPFMRVDLYQINGVVYFGEYTFYHAAGLTKYDPESWDYTMGDWIVLPK